jgi:hypothetical protein
LGAVFELFICIIGFVGAGWVLQNLSLKHQRSIPCIRGDLEKFLELRTNFCVSTYDLSFGNVIK